MKEFTFKPNLPTDSHKQFGRRRGPIEDQLNEEIDKKRYRLEEIKRMVELERTKELTFKPKLFTPPPHIVPRYRYHLSGDESEYNNNNIAGEKNGGDEIDKYNNDIRYRRERKSISVDEYMKVLQNHNTNSPSLQVDITLNEGTSEKLEESNVIQDDEGYTVSQNPVEVSIYTSEELTPFTDDIHGIKANGNSSVDGSPTSSAASQVLDSAISVPPLNTNEAEWNSSNNNINNGEGNIGVTSNSADKLRNVDFHPEMDINDNGHENYSTCNPEERKSIDGLDVSDHSANTKAITDANSISRLGSLESLDGDGTTPWYEKGQWHGIEEEKSDVSEVIGGIERLRTEDSDDESPFKKKQIGDGKNKKKKKGER